MEFMIYFFKKIQQVTFKLGHQFEPSNIDNNKLMIFNTGKRFHFTSPILFYSTC